MLRVCHQEFKVIPRVRSSQLYPRPKLSRYHLVHHYADHVIVMLMGGHALGPFKNLNIFMYPETLKLMHQEKAC